MKLVGSGLGQNIYHSAAGATQFRRVAVRVHFYFLDHVDGRAYQQGELLPLVVVHAIDQLIVEDLVLAVGDDVGGLAALVGARAAQDRIGRSSGHTHGALHQCDEVAAVQGQVLHRLSRDHR